MELEQLADKLRKRMDVIILLLLEGTPGCADTISDKIKWLAGTGLSNREVSEIVGKPANYVGAVLSAEKKVRRKKESKG